MKYYVAIYLHDPAELVLEELRQLQPINIRSKPGHFDGEMCHVDNIVVILFLR